MTTPALSFAMGTKRGRGPLVVKAVVVSTPAQLRADARDWRAMADQEDRAGRTGRARACRAQADRCDRQADAGAGNRRCLDCDTWNAPSDRECIGCGSTRR